MTEDQETTSGEAAAEHVSGVSARTIVVVVLAVVALLAAAILAKTFVFPSPSGAPIAITIPQGASVAGVASTLAKRGIVPSALFFKVWVLVSGSTSRLEPGDYVFRRGTPYASVVSDLRKGTNIPQAKIVVPEGFTIRQIARRLQAKAGLSAQKFEQLAFGDARRYDYPYLKDITTHSLEGYLFPKTYVFRLPTTEQEVLKRMVEQFGKDTAGLPWERASKMHMTPYQIVTVASMIEKETSRAEERRRIAGVIYNRLTFGIPNGVQNRRLKRLQVDATVLYALGRDSGPLTIDEYRSTASHYNTYVYEGLPPGPISNPGVASIYAALVPESNPYFFYVAKGDGSHDFATTFEEFKAIKRQLGYGG